MAAFPGAATRLIEQALHTSLATIETVTQADVLAFFGSIHFRADDLIREAIESRRSKCGKLVVILETDGGYAEVVERIVRVFRNYYGRVEFIIPDRAMSAGTILVMSGDAIHMGYYSILGPIDPQLPRRDGNGMLPALGYLAEYNRLIRKSAQGTLSTAEMAFLIEKFDPAELHDYKQARGALYLPFERMACAVQVPGLDGNRNQRTPSYARHETSSRSGDCPGSK
jgi:ClpP class serine protease